MIVVSGLVRGELKVTHVKRGCRNRKQPSRQLSFLKNSQRQRGGDSLKKEYTKLKKVLFDLFLACSDAEEGGAQFGRATFLGQKCLPRGTHYLNSNFLTKTNPILIKPIILRCPSNTKENRHSSLMCLCGDASSKSMFMWSNNLSRRKGCPSEVYFNYSTIMGQGCLSMLWVVRFLQSSIFETFEVAFALDRRRL